MIADGIQLQLFADAPSVSQLYKKQTNNPVSNNVAPNLRLLKIQYGLYPGSRKYHPVIRLAGFWLKNQGFCIGDQIQIEALENEIRIKKLISQVQIK
jgi:hypothetical protein